ncbi:MAG TPA: HEAT repeat domain-containing protein [bacterium]|nr:HEAT repeat domain-containing protein [bacterium]HOL67470.1 HEAT repeat domain-containing protein [bacterium]HPP13220.1 HEAT repeat domain-containing protein [bacterium]
MEDIRIFYQRLTRQKRIIFWVTVAVIFLSLLRFGVWIGTRNKRPTPKTYLKQLRSRNKDARLSAIYSAGRLGLKDTVPVLVEIVETDPDVHVRRMAAASLGRLDQDKLFELFNSQNRQTKDLALETLAKLDKKNVLRLFDKIEQQDKETQGKLLDYASSLNEPELAEKLLSFAEDTKKPLELRTKCLELLKTKATLEMESRLMNLMYNDPEEEVKKLAKEVIAIIRGGKKS